MGSLCIQTYRLNPSKPSSQESRGFNHGSAKNVIHEVRGTRKVDIMAEEKSNEAKTVARRSERNDHNYAVRAIRDIRDSFFDPTFDPLWAALGVHTPSVFDVGPRMDALHSLYRGFDETRGYAGARVYYNDDGSVTVIIDLPGYKKEDLKLTWPDDRTLTVSASERSDDENHYCRRSQTITRRFDHDVDVDSADAKFVDGVLTVKIAAAEPAEPAVKTTEIK